MEWEMGVFLHDQDENEMVWWLHRNTQPKGVSGSELRRNSTEYGARLSTSFGHNLVISRKKNLWMSLRYVRKETKSSIVNSLIKGRKHHILRWSMFICPVSSCSPILLRNHTLLCCYPNMTNPPNWSPSEVLTVSWIHAHLSQSLRRGCWIMPLNKYQSIFWFLCVVCTCLTFIVRNNISYQFFIHYLHNFSTWDECIYHILQRIHYNF